MNFYVNLYIYYDNDLQPVQRFVSLLNIIAIYRILNILYIYLYILYLFVYLYILCTRFKSFYKCIKLICSLSRPI